MGYTHEQKQAASQSVSFALTPGDPNYQQQFDEIRSATSIEQLKKVMSKYKSLMGAHTESTSTGSTGTTTMGVGPASLGIISGSERGKSVETDADGKVTTTVTGSNTGGATLSVPGYKATTATTEKLEVKVESDGTASGDVTNRRRSQISARRCQGCPASSRRIRSVSSPAAPRSRRRRRTSRG